MQRSILWVALRRLLFAVPLFFLVSALSFTLASLAPGDPAHQILGVSAPPSRYAALRRELGLDQPLYAQYWHWLRRALGGDFGTSLFSGENVTHAINTRISVTLSLILCSLLLALVLGVLLGIASATGGRTLGRFVDSLALIGFAVPGFWLGAILISVFAVKVHWFPATGYVPLTDSLRGWVRSLSLPVLALALNGLAVVAKQTREALLDTLTSEHIRTARANGIPTSSLIFRHGLRAAGIRVATILGLQAVGLLSGTVLVENVFALPGVGGLLVNASVQHDLPVVQAIVVYFTAVVIVINLFVDITYAWLDPRVRTP